MSLFAIMLVLLSATIHAGWNLLAHSRQVNGNLFFLLHLITAIVGFLPVLIAELTGTSFPLSVWGLLILSGMFQALYFLGLTMGYRYGNFTVVYPVARALPVLFLAVVDISRNRVPSLLGWLGILLVTIGCLLAPLQSLRKITISAYWNRTTVWIIVIMCGTVGYTTVGKVAAELLPSGAGTAARYGVLEATFTLPFLWLFLKWVGEPINKLEKLADWKWASIFALLIFCSYWLMLWAYQISPYISYLTALRQFSIVIGVVTASFIFKEPAPILRISAAIMITLGIFCIGQAQ
jgi:drug/metabolite transporter (DMT)-like permease